MAAPNPARLSAIGSKTLTLAMERQRLLSISPPSQTHIATGARSSSSSSVSQITKNLVTLREGIMAIESAQGSSKQTHGLREQYSSILSVLGEDEAATAGVQSLPAPPRPKIESLIPAAAAATSSSSRTEFRDDPEQTNDDMFVQQKQIMQDQDTQLDVLSQSIGRQHHLSLQINDELGEQAGLLDGLDEDIDRTGARMQRAHRTLDKVSRGAKENCSTVTIGIVIFVLLILIVIFKT